jgi:cellulose synthase/poly-beta-1,6-N-acetylglucosamine synthase-like glycosyltransferase
MAILFWLLLAIIFYTYFGYPLFILFISLFVGRKVARADIEPSVTFLITAYNEEKSIKEKIEDTIALDYPKEKLEILVASDASSDNTDNIIKGFQDKRIRLFRVEGRVGKTQTQNQAIQRANGEIIIFSDATTKYEKTAIRKIVRNYADSTVGAVSGRYKYFDPNQSQIGIGTIAFWDYENFIKMRQTKIRTITGCCGCIYSVRRNLYIPLPRDIISDLVEPLKVLEQGYRIVFEPEALAYETTCQNSDEEFKMRLRVISRGMRGLLYMKHLLNPFKYGFISFQLISHKILRWLIPLFLAILYITNIFLIQKNIFYLIFFSLQSIFCLLALIGLLIDYLPKKIKIFSLPLYFCVVNIASVVALVKTLMKKKDITWETVRQ